jgi:metallophosphoesterase superfamily enzyme
MRNLPTVKRSFSMESFLQSTNKGLYCIPGGFFVDPQWPVERAVVIDLVHLSQRGIYWHEQQSSISQDIQNSRDVFFAQHSQLRFTLVAGNHDRNVRELFNHWPIEIVESGTQVGRISISHFPQPPSVESDLLLCGHIHPAYRSHSKTDSVGKLPCFWLSKRQLVLPAIGEFTGTKIIKPSKADRTWVIAENQVIAMFPAK